jgi:hypothetical protein
MKLLIKQHSLVSCYFLLGPNIFLILFLNAVSLCSSVDVKDQVSHPYKTGKSIVSYVFIFTFLDSRWGGNSELDGSKQFPNLFCL